MSAPVTPEGASALAAEFLAILPGMASAILSGSELRLHQSIAARAQVLCELPATAAVCGQIEECLGVLVNLWMDAPRFRARPRTQALVILDSFEIAGAACHAAAGATP